MTKLENLTTTRRSSETLINTTQTAKAAKAANSSKITMKILLLLP